MLKTQGLVTEDPEYVATAVFAPSLPPRQPELDEEQQEKLRKLLQSKNPEDLQTANTMIKSMVSKGEERMERLSKRLQQLQSVTSNVKLLDDMMESHRRGGSSSDEMELMAELSSSCEKLRPGLYRLASELAEDDGSIGEVLAASDELTRVIDTYKALVASERAGLKSERSFVSNSDLLTSNIEPTTSAVTSLLDLALDQIQIEDAPNNDHVPMAPKLLSEEDILGQEDLSRSNLPLSAPAPDTEHLVTSNAPSVPLGTFDAATTNLTTNKPSVDITSQSPSKWQVDLVSEKLKTKRGMEDLDLLGESLIRENLSGQNLTNFEARKIEKLPLNTIMKRDAKPETLKMIEARDLTKELFESSSIDFKVVNTSDETKPMSSHEETKCDEAPKKVQEEDVEVVKWNDIHIAMSKIQPNKSASPIQLQVNTTVQLS